MDSFKTLVEWFHEQPWQIMTMRHMKHIVIASHDGNMFVRVGVEIALGDFSVRSTQQIYYHLDALLPAVRSGEDHDPSDLKAMLICCIDVFEPFFYCLD